jgi:5-methylcytosine-specific restriction endonuclease McrA
VVFDANTVAYFSPQPALGQVSKRATLTSPRAKLLSVLPSLSSISGFPMMEFDTKIFRLGRLCKNGHDFNGLGQSIRYQSNGRCIDCMTDTKPYIKREKHPVPGHLIGTFDQSIFRLGSLCRNGHDFKGSGKTLRKIDGGHCLDCLKNYKQSYYKENRETLLAKQAAQRRENQEQVSIRRKKWYRENREKHLQKCAEYVKRNKEKVAARGALYYQRNKEKLAERNAEYRRKNSDKLRVSSAQYYQRNKEIIAQKSVEYRARNAEALRQYRARYIKDPRVKARRLKSEQKRRALKAANHHAAFTLEQLEEHFSKFDNHCAYCGKSTKLTIDHFIPISLGGSDCLSNILPACWGCNASKNKSDPKRWYQRQPFYSAKRWKHILKVLGKSEDNYFQIPLL